MKTNLTSKLQRHAKRALIVLALLLACFCGPTVAVGQVVRSIFATGSVASDQITGLVRDSAGNLYATGNFRSSVNFDGFTLTSAGSTDAFVVKFSPAGAVLWAVSLAGTGFDSSTGIALAADGGVIVVGSSTSGADFDPGVGTTALPLGGFVWHLSSTGTLVWAGVGTNVAPADVAVASNGDVLISGSYASSPDFDPSAQTATLSGTGGFVWRLTGGGAYVWARGFTSSGPAHGVASAPDGSIYLCGEFGVVADFDPAAGTSFSLTPLEGNDAFFVKLDSAGSFVWARQLGSAGGDRANAVAVASDGNPVFGGIIMGNAAFEPSSANHIILASSVASNGFVTKITTGGDFIWGNFVQGGEISGVTTDLAGNVYSCSGPAAKFDSAGMKLWSATTSFPFGTRIQAAESGEVWVGGIFFTTLSFINNGITTTLSSFGGSDIAIEKLGPPALGFTAPVSAAQGQAVNIPLKALAADGSTAVDYKGTVHFTSSDPGAILPPDTLVTQLSGGTGTGIPVTFSTLGLHTITATDTQYPLSTGTSATILVKLAQTISFGALPDRVFGDAPFNLSATSSAALPVTFSIVSGPATLSGSQLTTTGSGAVTVRAAQAGDTNYSAAPNVDVTFTVGKKAQTITLNAIADRTIGAGAFNASASATSGLAVTLSVLSGPATISGNSVTPTGTGTVTLAANQAGNTTFLAAPQATATFNITPQLSQTINLPPISDRAFGAASFAVSASATSGLAVALTVQSGPATLSGNTLTLRGAGVVIIAATQSGNVDYLAAPQATTSCTVTQPAPQAATGNQGAGNTLTLLGNGASGLIYTITAPPSHGTLTGSGSSQIYTPDPAYVGADSFTYSVFDPGSNTTTLVVENVAVNPVLPVFTLSSATYSVNEGAGAVTVTVQKNISVAGSVNFSTQNGSASAVLAGFGDYTGVAGALSFASGERSQTVVIPINEDTTFEGDQTFNFVLTSATNGGSIGSPGTAVVTIVDNDTFGSAASFTDAISPTLPPASNGAIFVALDPANVGGQWRLSGETRWRDGSQFVQGLTTGDYTVEFKPLADFLPPPSQTVPVTAGGAATNVTGNYIGGGVPAVGALQVLIKPSTVANPAINPHGRWRRQGEVNANGTPLWHNSGETLNDLPAGVYLIEFDVVPGRTTPTTQTASVAGLQLTTVAGTYFVEDSTQGATPSALTFSTATADPQFPYRYLGQIQTDSGFGSGVVLKERVVLTAGHVAFDDGTLSYATGMRWRFQRYASTEQPALEPVPQTPRGAYLFEGYASQRTADNSPGTSSPLSQNLDAAAIYFIQPAGRGGYSGFLVSDADNNQWLQSARNKMVAGYPVEGVAAANIGKPHATAPFNVNFSRLYNRVFATNDITSFPGNSGGPIFAQGDDSRYYPAAIYLGGSSQTIVRAIDSGIAELIIRAEVSANGGGNNNSGGITHTNSPLAAQSSPQGTLLVAITPPQAVSLGAQWKFSSDTIYRASGNQVPLSTGKYVIQYKPLSGFSTPVDKEVQIESGVNQSITGTYVANTPPTIVTTALGDGIEDEPYRLQVVVTGNPNSITATGLGALGLQMSASGLITGTINLGAVGAHPITITATNGVGPTSKNFTLQVRESGELVLHYDPTGGSVKGRPKAVGIGSSALGEGAEQTLIATPKSPAFLFAGWVVEGATPATSTEPKLTFTMTKLVTVTANFIENPFPALAANYSGRVAPVSGALLTQSGTLTLKVSKLGGFTGKLRIGGDAYSIKGDLLPDGTARLFIPRRKASNLVLELALDLDPGDTGRILGELTIDGAKLPISLDRELPYAEPGDFTLALSPDPDLTFTAFPGGHGFGAATILKDGTVRFVGTLGDGTPIAQSSSISKTGAWPFHVPLYKNGGVITGELTIQETPGVSDLDGTLDWLKPAITGVKTTYPQGFSGSVSVIGSRFDKSELTAYSQGTATFSSGGIASMPPISIGTKLEGFSLRYKASTGLFKGTFRESGASKSYKFEGAVLGKTGEGYGVFIGAGLPLPGGGLSTGSVTLSP